MVNRVAWGLRVLNVVKVDLKSIMPTISAIMVLQRLIHRKDDCGVLEPNCSGLSKVRVKAGVLVVKGHSRYVITTHLYRLVDHCSRIILYDFT